MKLFGLLMLFFMIIAGVLTVFMLVGNVDTGAKYYNFTDSYNNTIGPQDRQTYNDTIDLTGKGMNLAIVPILIGGLLVFVVAVGMVLVAGKSNGGRR